MSREEIIAMILEEEHNTLTNYCIDDCKSPDDVAYMGAAMDAINLFAANLIDLLHRPEQEKEVEA